jgi:Signal peptidase, peptidase S26
MLTTLLPILAGVLVVALLVNAVLLWLTCKMLGVRYQPAEGRPAAGVRFGRALTLAACSLTASVVLGVAFWALPIDHVLLVLNGHFALWMLLSLVILRLGLPVSWLRAAGVEAAWTLLSLPAVAVGVALSPLAFSEFVVPSGAMAETLRGDHKEVVCPQCGHAFAVNASAEVDSDGEGTHVSGCTCPNCREAIRLHAGPLPPPAGSLPDPGVTGGDRILVGRALLGAERLPPERFDVVLFEWPGDRGQPPPSPPVLHVRRVVGLPGEAIAIHRGDLFVCIDEAELTENEERIVRRIEERPWVRRRVLERVDESEDFRRLLRQGKFRLLRKPPAKVLALMHPVYDSRHPAKDLAAPEERRWVEDNDSGWFREGTGFRHGGGDEVGWLRYRHVLRGSVTPSLITDFTGYNQWEPHQPPGENWANDLILECEADPGSSGQLTLELSRGPDRFQARFDLERQTCSLLRLTKHRQAETLQTANAKVPAKGARLRFANVDERLIVWVNDRLVFADGVEYDGPAALLPEQDNDRDRPASVGVKGAAVRVKRLRLLRDVYYTTGSIAIQFGGVVRLVDFDATDPGTWKALEQAPATIHRIDKRSYFMLGDNSQESYDSRSWGPVQDTALVGKVFLRYHPLSRFGRVE